MRGWTTLLIVVVWRKRKRKKREVRKVGARGLLLKRVRYGGKKISSVKPWKTEREVMPKKKKRGTRWPLEGGTAVDGCVEKKALGFNVRGGAAVTRDSE